jgi:hypothetical protein
MMIAGSIRRRQFYQEVQNGEAGSVAQFASSRCSGDSAITRRSYACGQQDPIEDELVNLARFREKQDVCKMLKNIGMILV